MSEAKVMVVRQPLTVGSAKMTLFYNKTSPFSNWYFASFSLPHPDDAKTLVKYNCVEQRMMHAKACLFKATGAAQRIMAAPDPGKHKSIGRQIKNFDEKLWDANKVAIVEAAVAAKFRQNPKLLAQLLAAGPEFAEASPADAIWGIGLAAGDLRAQDKKQWRGQNLLGEILGRVRLQLAAEMTKPAVTTGPPPKFVLEPALGKSDA